jgi:putative ABC transport system permease protein
VTLVGFAFRNLSRKKLRTLLTVLGAAVAVLSFVSLRTVLTSWSAASDYAAKDRLATRHKVSLMIQMPKRYVEMVRAVPGVKQATYMSWFGGKNPKNPSEFFVSIAVDPQSFLDVMDEVVIPPAQQQRWKEDKQGAIVGDMLAKRLGVKVGDRFTLQGGAYPGDWAFNIDAIYTTSRKSLDRSQFYLHWSYLNESPALAAVFRDQVGWIATRVDDPQRGPEVAAAIDRTFADKDVQTVTMSERAMNLSFMGMFGAMLKALDVISFIILVIMMMIVGNTIAMAVRERIREYGVLRALGFAPAQIRLIVIGEAMALGLVAAVLGIVLAIPFVEQGIGRFLEENMGAWFPYFRIEKATYAAAIGAALTLAAAASALPAVRAGRLSVTNALRRVA